MRRTPLQDRFDDQDEPIRPAPDRARRISSTPGSDANGRRGEVRYIRGGQRPAVRRPPSKRVWFVRGALGVAALAGLWLGLQVIFPATESRVQQAPPATVAVDASTVGRHGSASGCPVSAAHCPAAPACPNVDQSGRARRRPSTWAANAVREPARPGCEPVGAAGRKRAARGDTSTCAIESGCQHRSHSPRSRSPSSKHAPSSRHQPRSHRHVPRGRRPSPSQLPNPKNRPSPSRRAGRLPSLLPLPSRPPKSPLGRRHRSPPRRHRNRTAAPAPAASTSGGFQVAASASPANPLSEQAQVTISVRATQNGAPISAGAPGAWRRSTYRTATAKQPNGSSRRTPAVSAPSCSTRAARPTASSSPST